MNRQLLPEIFSDSDDWNGRFLSFLDGWVDSNGTISLQRGRLASLAELNDYLQLENSFKRPTEKTLRFRVLSVPKQPENWRKWILSQESYADIKRLWNLHDFTIDCSINNNGIFAFFHTPRTRSWSLLYKQPISTVKAFRFISLTKNCHSDITYALAFELEDEEDIFSSFESAPSSGTNSLHLVVAAYSSLQQRTESYRQKIDAALVDIESKTGFGKSVLIGMEDYDTYPKLRHDSVDYEDLVRKLSYIQSEIAIISHLGRHSIESGNCLRKEIQSRKWSTNASDSEIDLRLMDAVDFDLIRNRSLMSQLEQLESRVKSQTTLVSYVCFLNNIQLTLLIADAQFHNLQ
jgi:hypothetical protein